MSKHGIDADSLLQAQTDTNKDFVKLLLAEFDRVKLNLDPHHWETILDWNDKINRYKNPIYTYKVRGKDIKVETHSESLSHTQIAKVALPKYQAWGNFNSFCQQF